MSSSPAGRASAAGRGAGDRRCPPALGSTGQEFSTLHLLDEMNKKAVGTGENPFRVLPDDLLEYILSFLPGEDALQSCVLNTQWRDLWRRKTSLCFDWRFGWSSHCSSLSISDPERFRKLVKLIIHLRGNSPLTDCHINLCPRNFTQTKLLIKYALKCGVEKLTVGCGDLHGKWLSLSERLVSPHLRIIEFYQVELACCSLDFSRCPALEELTMGNCSIYGNISSESLKHVRLTGDGNFPRDFRIHIHGPCLISISLLLDGADVNGLTPSLGIVPLLKRACVRLGYSYDDSPKNNRDNECLLFDGLSNAVDLELIAKPKMFIYRWDSKWCPKFDKLKTLVLSDWFTTIDLVCILKHTPILEKLTLLLLSAQDFEGATGSKQSLECASSLAVNIECGKDDERVRKILQVLSGCGILREHISIKCRGCT